MVLGCLEIRRQHFWPAHFLPRRPFSGGSMPRLFTGLEIPSDLASELALLRGGLFGARWIDAENYHITLRFIGDIDDATAHDVYTTLERIKRSSFTVTLEGLSSFGGGKPRAIV